MNKVQVTYSSKGLFFAKTRVNAVENFGAISSHRAKHVYQSVHQLQYAYVLTLCFLRIFQNRMNDVVALNIVKVDDSS